MIRLKQIGKTINVFVNNTSYVLNDVDDFKQRQLYKCTVIYNKTGSQYILDKLLEIVKPSNRAQEELEQKLKAQRKKLKHEQKLIDPALKRHFTLKSNSIQIKGIDVDFPLEYLRVINESTQRGYDPKAIKNFLQLLALNPSKYIRDNLFEFFIANNFPITENGFIVALRRVHLYDENGPTKRGQNNAFSDEYREKILSAYGTVKAYKKSPSKYYLAENGRPTRTENGETLEQLYEKLDKKVERNTWYTDNHTRSFRWQLQTICDKPRGESIGHEDSNCSGGFFHLGSKDHVVKGYSYGNIILLCLVNPMNCTNIPHGQTWKFGTCEFFPVAEISEEDVHEIFQNPFDVIGTLDEAYERLDLFGIPVGVEFTLKESDKIEAINEKLKELRAQAELYHSKRDSLTIGEFLEFEKIIQERIIEL